MDNQKHSGLGIASFITSITSGIILFLIVVIAGIMEATTPGGIDESSVSAIVLGLFLLFFLGVAFIALGLGIGGLLQKNRKKIFSILGTAFSIIPIVVTILLIIFGQTMQ